MSKSLFIMSTEERAGRSVIELGILQMLKTRVKKIAFFKPVAHSQDNEVDHTVELAIKYFDLDMALEDAWVFTQEEARSMLSQGLQSQFIEAVLTRYKDLEERYDFIVCEGADVQPSDASFVFELNVMIAAALGAPVVFVASGRNKTAAQTVDSVGVALDAMFEEKLHMLAIMVNRVNEDDVVDVRPYVAAKARAYKGSTSIFVLPEDDGLDRPSMNDVKAWVHAEVLEGASLLGNRVRAYIVAAMRVANFLNYLEKDCLVVVPADRSDIILGCYAARFSPKFPNIAGVLLTGDMPVAENIAEIISAWEDASFPILKASGDTFTTARRLLDMRGKIHFDDQQKIARALGVFDGAVNVPVFLRSIDAAKSESITPEMFQYGLFLRARKQRRHIVLPEGDSERILKAADMLVRRDIVDLTLLGNPDEIAKTMSRLNIKLEIPIIDPGSSEHFEEFVDKFVEIRKGKNVTQQIAHDLILDPTYFGTMMVQSGLCDGMVSGSTTTTQHTIRPAFQIIKNRPDVLLVSSVFFMCLKDKVLVYGDCAVNPDPNPEELAQIALSSAETAYKFGIEPRVALLSYSTGSSGKGAHVDKVVEAVKIAQARAPELLLEGPIQYDAAIDPAVAATKLPGSKVAGRATVFIFPDLDTGNNTYKAVQRSAGAIAMGPVLQGLNKPVNDLSRGCTVEDIVYTVAITAIQAQD
ncbi:phosphate acetyltransferase [Desulfovibrio inopinatus]|uniref:phosphate acetyltransferase n=1 Tax=Desulfovibrio inopinatus TaxID=102109 RepID=UPI000416FFCF|nr:phosphate acetyltransferase [Desulfovibrio inopinatus]